MWVCLGKPIPTYLMPIGGKKVPTPEGSDVVLDVCLADMRANVHGRTHLSCMHVHDCACDSGWDLDNDLDNE